MMRPSRGKMCFLLEFNLQVQYVYLKSESVEFEDDLDD
jgi:hypothetical protein